jgi:hypothetical protein
LTGTLNQTGPDRGGNDTITIDAQLDSGAVGSVHVVLSGRAIDDGGVTLSSGTVTLTSNTSDSFTGAVTALHGDVIDALVRTPSGSSVTLELNLVLDGTSVTGTAHGVSQ